MEKTKLYRVRDGIVQMLSSGLIFTNRKTDFCVELNICSLMKQVNEGGKISFKTPKCKSCYAAPVLSVYTNLRDKVLSIPKEKEGLLESFKQDLQKLKALCEVSDLGPLTRLRFYGLTDFAPDNIPFILAAAEVFTVDLISKSLAMKHNEDYLKALINHPNVWISLSFNKDFQKDLPRIEQLLLETKANNVQLNYCLHTKEENPVDPWYDRFQVIHQRDLNKWNAVSKGVSPSRVCGLYDRNGKELEAQEKGAHCRNCSNCHRSYVEAMTG